MNPDDLIDSLSKDLKPVKPLQKPIVRFIYWCVLYFVLLIPFALFLSPMPGMLLNKMLNNPWHLAEVLSAFSIFFAGGLCSFSLLIPGYRPKKAIIFAVVSVLVFLLLSLRGMWVHQEMPSMMNKRPHCLFEVIGYSFFAVGLFLVFLRKTLPLQKKSMAFLIAWTCTSLPVALMQVGCVEHFTHSLKFHILPMIILVFLMGIGLTFYIRFSEK